MECKICGNHHYAEITMVGYSCDSCGDIHKELKVKGYAELERENAELKKQIGRHSSITAPLIQALELASKVTYLPEVRARIVRVIEIMKDISDGGIKNGYRDN